MKKWSDIEAFALLFLGILLGVLLTLVFTSGQFETPIPGLLYRDTNVDHTGQYQHLMQSEEGNLFLLKEERLQQPPCKPDTGLWMEGVDGVVVQCGEVLLRLLSDGKWEVIPTPE